MFKKVALTLLVMSFFVCLSKPAEAAFRYWVGESGYYDDTSHWSDTEGGKGGFSVPEAGDFVSIDMTDSLDRTILYRTLSKTAPVLGMLVINSTGTGNMLFAQEFHSGYSSDLASNYEYVGYDGTGTHYQKFGENVITYDLSIGHWSYGVKGNGTYDLRGGDLTANNEYVGHYGTGYFYQRDGNNTVADGLYVGDNGIGTYDHLGGYVTTHKLYLGAKSIASGGYGDGVGTYNLSGDLTSDIEYIGYQGRGTVNQASGTNTVSANLYVKDGEYNLSGGVLDVADEHIGYDYKNEDPNITYTGDGKFNQDGGTHNVAGNINIGKDYGPVAEYNFTGGVLNVSGDVINRGNFKIDGGEFHGDISNHSNFTVVNTDDTSAFFIDTYSFYNYGKVSIDTGGAVEPFIKTAFNGYFTNYGEIATEDGTYSSTIIFDDLAIYNSGYITGNGNEFKINGDFNSRSTQYDLYDTTDATLRFEVFGPASNHDLVVNGFDMGRGADGYNHNFAWDKLWIGPDDVIQLRDTIAGDNAFYVSSVYGAEISGSTINNIQGKDPYTDEEIEIYYLAYDPQNSYLGGLDYSLNGGGSLLAIKGRYWTGDPNSLFSFWNSDDWTPNGVPKGGEDVYLTYNADVDSRIYYTSTSYSDELLEKLYIDCSGSGTLTFDMALGMLNDTELHARNEYIGYDGNVAVVQDDGAHEITENLYLGYNSASTAIFTLTGGSLAAGNEELGRNGTASFIQSGGSHTITEDLLLGYGLSGYGEYTLNGGELNVGNMLILGRSGTGIFNQTGGTNRANGLLVGVYDTSTAVYNLEGGDLIIGTPGNPIESVSIDSGDATFNHTGGTHTIYGQITLGQNTDQSGVYNLSGADSTLNAMELKIGYRGDGVFTQSGGTVNLSNGMAMGYMDTGTGTYNLSGGDLITSNNANVLLGSQGEAVFNHTGGTHEIALGGLFIGGVGSLGTGEYNLSGTGLLDVYKETLAYSGDGTFNQTGGMHNIQTDLQIGYGAGSTGRYTLSGGTLDIGGNIINGSGLGYMQIDGGTLNVGGSSIDIDSLYVGYGPSTTGSFSIAGGQAVHSLYQIIGGGGAGSFNQSAGTNTLTNWLIVGSNYRMPDGSYVYGNGTYTLSGDASVTLSASRELIGTSSGSGTFTQSGGVNTVTELMQIGSVSGEGTYNMEGGVLDAASILNNGTLNYSGGSLIGDITNNSEINASGAGDRIFDGAITNNSKFNATNTNVYFTGLFTNNSEYISDPSDNYFHDLLVGGSGYLVGGEGDNFYISGDFDSSSEMDLDWNTEDALLSFYSGGDHLFSLTGEDLGAVMGGYDDNFAWGSLFIEEGNNLLLEDGNLDTGGALYLGEILGADISGDSVLNIFGSEGLNIYYLAGLEGNEYLGGLTYNLAGGGQLIASAVPIPGAVWILGSGLAGLVVVRRRSLKK